MQVALGAEHYIVPAGGVVKIDAHGVCRTVSNTAASGGYGTMVPTKTSAEWHEGGQSFLENLPVNITVSDCELYGPDAFVVVYDSTKSNDGTSSTQILVKKGSAGNFDFNVSWEDSLGVRGTATGLMDDYIIEDVAPGLVTVAITGSFPHFRDTIVRNGVVDVKQWGTQKWMSMRYAFGGENALVEFSATDTPDTSLLTNTRGMFYNNSSFNGILDFDASNVTNMSSMFYGASAFNQPVNLDTSSVLDMSDMFYDAKSFNQPLYFNTSKVLTMDFMFSGASSFNQPINWDTSSVIYTDFMFFRASSFNQPLDFDTSKVVDMTRMFSAATSFNQLLELDTSNVKIMIGMFWGADAFNQPLNFNTSNVTDMGFMFYDSVSFNQDLSGWCVAKIPSIPAEFDYNTNQWDKTGRQPNWGAECPFYGPDAFVVEYNTANGDVLVKKGTTGTFNYDVAWQDSLGARGSATGQTGDYQITGAAPGLVTVAITGNFPHLKGALGNTGIVDVKQWGTQKWASMASAFAGEAGLTEFSATDMPDLSLVTDMSGMFRNATLFNGALDFDTSNVKNMANMFWGAADFNQPLNFDTSNVTNMGYMFYYAGSFDGALTFSDTSNVVSMAAMFGYASSFNQPLSFDTLNVTDMSNMFNGAAMFNQPVGFDTSSVTSMMQMFVGASAFNRPLDWDVSNVTDMSNMFINASVFNQDLSGWCVTKIAAMPVNFDANTPAWVKAGRQPVWGTCLP